MNVTLLDLKLAARRFDQHGLEQHAVTQVLLSRAHRMGLDEEGMQLLLGDPWAPSDEDAGDIATAETTVDWMMGPTGPSDENAEDAETELTNDPIVVIFDIERWTGSDVLAAGGAR